MSLEDTEFALAIGTAFLVFGCFFFVPAFLIFYCFAQDEVARVASYMFLLPILTLPIVFIAWQYTKYKINKAQGESRESD